MNFFKIYELIFQFQWTFYFWFIDIHCFNSACSLWIMHYNPRYIEISAATVRRHLCMFEDMEHDFFDIVIRRFKQYDEERTKEPHSSIVKHFMESDVAVPNHLNWKTFFSIFFVLYNFEAMNIITTAYNKLIIFCFLCFRHA